MAVARLLTESDIERRIREAECDSLNFLAHCTYIVRRAYCVKKGLLFSLVRVETTRYNGGSFRVESKSHAGKLR